MAIMVLLTLIYHAPTTAAMKVLLKGDARALTQANKTTPVKLDAKSGCPGTDPDASNCPDWYSVGCGGGSMYPTDCPNSAHYSPFALTLDWEDVYPRVLAQERDDDRWWTGMGCNSETSGEWGTCTDVWTVFDMQVPGQAVGAMRLLNYQDSYGVFKAQFSASDSITGPFEQMQEITDIPSKAQVNSGSPGNLGWTWNHGYQIPDTLLTFTPQLTGQYIKLQIMENHGDGGTGFYRAVFYEGNPTPAPPPPTPPPTPPTPAPPTAPQPASTSASAKGDPHLQNIHGQRFDLMRAGRHVLLHIPKGVDAPHTLLRVEAEVQRLGPECGDMYFQHVNISGAWVAAKHEGVLQFHAGEGGGEAEPTWMTFGAVNLKVVRVHWQGIHYLNIVAKHLGHTGFTVGGLLGEDDHTYESTPERDCIPRLNLYATAMSMDSKPPSAHSASSAEASLA